MVVQPDKVVVHLYTTKIKDINLQIYILIIRPVDRSGPENEMLPSICDTID